MIITLNNGRKIIIYFHLHHAHKEETLPLQSGESCPRIKSVKPEPFLIANPSGRGFFYCFHYTECTIFDVLSETKDPNDSTKTIINKSIVGAGTSYCSTSDQHHPFSGKKMALSIAMKNCRFSRDIRKEIWDRLLADEKARIEAKKANKEKRKINSSEDAAWSAEVPAGHS